MKTEYKFSTELAARKFVMSLPNGASWSVWHRGLSDYIVTVITFDERK